MFRTPASICFSAPKDVFVPGLIAGTVAGFGLVDCASAQPFMPNWAAARVMARAVRKRRRSWLISSAIFLLRLVSKQLRNDSCDNRQRVPIGSVLDDVAYRI